LSICLSTGRIPFFFHFNTFQFLNHIIKKMKYTISSITPQNNPVKDTHALDLMPKRPAGWLGKYYRTNFGSDLTH